MSQTKPSSNRLEVERIALIDELQRMAKVIGRRRNVGEAMLMHDVNRLVIRVAGVEFAIPAVGEWDGEARVAASFLRALAKVPPSQDPVVVHVQAGRLRIASSSMACQWQPPNTATIEVPLNQDLRARLRLAFEHSEADLRRSGIAPLIADAREEMERRIDAAARQLAPLGVSPADLRTLAIARMGIKK